MWTNMHEKKPSGTIEDGRLRRLSPRWARGDVREVPFTAQPVSN